MPHFCCSEPEYLLSVVAKSAASVPQATRVAVPARRAPGSISDYNPAGENHSSPMANKTQATTVYSSASGQRNGTLRVTAFIILWVMVSLGAIF